VREFCDSFKNKQRPYSLQEGAMFVNFPDRNLSKDEYEKVYYGNNIGNLREVKKFWDEDNFFDWSQGVRLLSLPSEEDSSGEGVLETSDLEHLQWAGYVPPLGMITSACLNFFVGSCHISEFGRSGYEKSY